MFNSYFDKNQRVHVLGSLRSGEWVVPVGMMVGMMADGLPFVDPWDTNG